MSLRVPGADTVEEFWNNLRNGVESITFFKPEELDPSIPKDVIDDPQYVPVRGIMKDASGFDAPFFNMNPNVAKVTDPQQRVLLELAWNALGACRSRFLPL
jgi:acyl transferase domain-containing protein